MSRGKAVVLLSGGIDSSTTLAAAGADGYELYAISFDYGQRHRLELESAGKIALAVGVQKHLVMSVDLALIGGSALTDQIAVPKNRSLDTIGSDIPITYVPARNTIFLSLALAWAEVAGARHILIGANAVDYSGYPDCRPEFIYAFESMANLATRRGVAGEGIEIRAPLMELTKAEIIRRGLELGLDYAMTFSCYDPTDDGLSCGECDSCRLRHRGFLDAEIADPTKYAVTPRV
ncbi:MAG TPA: 7-cyano-7-deazaguanine synthase QueC [Acidobacteriota bacterium]|nr:7-cyano-7-deazaguanine synthase QueC [Acidobacteriota bacterium]